MITQNSVTEPVRTVVIDSLDDNDQEKRIRKALGLAGGPLPDVQSQWLRRYHDYLSANLSLPFDAEYAEDIPGYRQALSRVTVEALVDPEEHGRHEEFGLYCRARRGTDAIEVPLADVELRTRSANLQLIEDYWYWFWNWRFDPSI